MTNEERNNGIFWYTITSQCTASLGQESKPTSDGNAFTQGIDVSGVITIPPTIDGYTITHICNFAIRNCLKITELHLPNTLKSLGFAAVSMTYVDSFVVPASIEVIDSYLDCFFTATSFIFEKGSKVRSIGEYFLKISPKIEYLEIPPSVQSIGNNFFFYTENYQPIIKVIFYCGRYDISANEMYAPQTTVIVVSKNYPSEKFFGRSVAKFSTISCQHSPRTTMKRCFHFSLWLLCIFLI